jgi:flagellar P-ring protein precursor FlgI
MQGIFRKTDKTPPVDRIAYRPPLATPWRFLLLGLLVYGCFSPANAPGQLRLGDICRVKGQEENVLQGLGLVVGLNGTGDKDIKPTSRALATMMQLMGNPLGQDAQNMDVLGELKDARNVAQVFVTVTVPAAGARQGDTLECRVSAIGAKSLEGGILMMTPLLGPRPASQRVYGFAQGPIELDNPDLPTSARVHQGCRLEEDFYNAFVEQGTITLVVDKNHAGFLMAQDIAELINSSQRYMQSTGSADQYMAKAIDPVNIQVRIPEQYQEDPVVFVSDILKQRIPYPQSEARVVINERTGSVIIGADVEIGPVAISHKNFVIETGVEAGSQFVPLDSHQRSTAKLKTLVDALNAIKVPTEDIIDILKGLERNGRLYGRVIIQ